MDGNDGFQVMSGTCWSGFQKYIAFAFELHFEYNIAFDAFQFKVFTWSVLTLVLVFI